MTPARAMMIIMMIPGLVMAAIPIEPGVTVSPASQVGPPLSEKELKSLKCSQLVEPMSSAVEKMLIILNPEFQSFQSKEEFVTKYCKPFASWYAVTKEYRRCLKDFPKSLFAMLMANIRKSYRAYCFSPKGIDIAYGHVTCLSEETKTPILRVADQLTTLFQFSSLEDDQQLLIKKLCCGAKEIQSVAIRDLTTICRPFTGNETGSWFTQIVYGVFTDIIDLMCGKYPSVEKCQQIEPEVYSIMKEVIGNATLFNDQSMINSMIRILSNLDESIDETSFL